jgi:peptidoglycan hydrolase-like protein with peptidoglycan-binding domain
MRTALRKTTLVGSILAVLTAGALSVSGAGAQTTTSKKSSTSSATAHSTSSHSAGASAKSAKSGKSSSRKGGKKLKGQAAPTPERINEIQSALAKNGAYDGTPSGKWDDSTVEAMKKFQSSHGLNPSGKLDAPTLQKLGLGSDTAGLAAPTPPPNSTANRLLSSRAQQDHPDN